MVQSQHEIGSSVLTKLKLDREERDKLRELEKKELELEEATREELSMYERKLEGMLTGKEKVDVAELSKLDEGIQRGQQFKGEITDLAESLSTELQELGQFLGDMSNYQGIAENLLARVGLTKLADKARLKRVKSADVKQNLETILDYGHHMVGKLYTAILQNVECYERIGRTIENTNTTLTENQPLYEQWRSQREKFERELKKVEEELAVADETKYAEIEKRKTQLQAELDDAQINENNYFTKVDKARKAIDVQRTHHKAYKDMVDALTQLRTGLDEDIKHVTELYMATPIAIQTALSTKAASQYDKSMKYATDISTDTVLRSARGVLDEAASRAERPLIERDKLDAYRKASLEMRAQYDTKMSEIKQRAAEGAFLSSG